MLKRPTDYIYYLSVWYTFKLCIGTQDFARCSSWYSRSNFFVKYRVGQVNWLIWSAFLWEGIAVFFLCARGFKSVLILELFCTFRMNYLDFRRWLKVFELLQRWLWVLLLSKELGRRNFYILYFSLQLFRPDLLLLFQLVLLISMLLLLPVVLLVLLEQRIWLQL